MCVSYRYTADHLFIFCVLKKNVTGKTKFICSFLYEGDASVFDFISLEGSEVTQLDKRC